MKKTTKIVISRDRYEELKQYERKLNALENAGVDNWEGYSYAMELLHEEESDDCE